MTDHRLTCAAVRELAPELALGTLEGTDRGAALAHLDRCASCRAHVHELSAAVDQLVALAPEAEPPPGFEAAVLGRVAHEQERDDPSLRQRRSVVRLAVAAAVFLLLGVGIGVAVSQAGVADGDGADLVSAAMITPDGDAVGEVWHSAGAETAVFISVPEWSDPATGGGSTGRFSLRLELEDGTTVDQGDFELAAGTSSWAESTRLAGDDIAAVSVLDADGDVWCTGTFA